MVEAERFGGGGVVDADSNKREIDEFLFVHSPNSQKTQPF